MTALRSRAWWDAAATRAIRTAAQTALAVIGTDVVGLLDVAWGGIGSAAALGAVLSLLTSLAGLPEVEADAA